MELRCWLEHGNITKQIKFKYKRNLKEIHVFAARTHTATQTQSCKQEMKKKSHSPVFAFALAFTSLCVLMLQRKILLKFVSSCIWGPCGVYMYVYFSLISLAKVSYLAKVDESLDLVTELETSEFHDQFHQQSALRAQSQN